MRVLVQSLIVSLGLVSASAAVAAPKVTATIPAVHSIVSGVMDGVGTPKLLIPGGASPHTYSLKPSDAQALSEAELVVWVGPQIETFLVEDLDTLAPKAKHLAMTGVDGITLLEIREGGIWDAHAHDHGDGHDHDAHEHKEHDHDAHDHEEHDHDHAKHDDHDHEAHAKHEDDHGHDHDHAKHDDHDHESHAKHDDHHGHGDETDGHVWLDPANAVVLGKAVADALSAIDPDNAATYAANQQAQAARLAELDAATATRLEAVADVPFIVFHDAYQYFEARYGLSAVGSVTVSADVAPGAARIREIQERIQDRGAKCVFAEPQFEPRVLTAVLEGSEARSGVLDPVGADIDPGAGFYPALITKLADDMIACLGEQS